MKEDFMLYMKKIVVILFKIMFLNVILIFLFYPLCKNMYGQIHLIMDICFLSISCIYTFLRANIDSEIPKKFVAFLVLCSSFAGSVCIPLDKVFVLYFLLVIVIMILSLINYYVIFMNGYNIVFGFGFVLFILVTITALLFEGFLQRIMIVLGWILSGWIMAWPECNRREKNYSNDYRDFTYVSVLDRYIFLEFFFLIIIQVVRSI